MQPEFLVVTRHKNLKEFLINKGLITVVTPSITHATMGDVLKKNVVGNLPMHLAAHTNAIMSLTINVPLDKRGTELSVEELEMYTSDFCWYKVWEIEKPWEA